MSRASAQPTGLPHDLLADQLAATMADVLAADEDDETTDSHRSPRPRRKNKRFAAETKDSMETVGIEPAQGSRREESHVQSERCQ
jgi:hypothetical protein